MSKDRKKWSILLALGLTICSTLTGCGGKKEIKTVNVKVQEASKIVIPVKDKDSFYYIDANGKKLFDKEFSYAGAFQDGIAVVEKKGKTGYIDTKGNYCVKPIYDQGSDMTNGYAVVEKNGQYGYIKQSGTIAIEPRYEEAYTFAKNGLARIKRNGKYLSLIHI